MASVSSRPNRQRDDGTLNASQEHRDTRRQTTTSAKRKRKPRPSTARGLRTSTGCLTCRKRRVKCDESRPRCGNCSKSARDCEFPQAGPLSDETSHQQTGIGAEPSSPISLVQGRTDGAQEFVQKVPDVDIAVDGQRSGPSSWPDFLPALEQPSESAIPQDSPATIFSSLLDFDQASLNSQDLAPYGWYDLVAADALADLEKHKHIDGELLHFNETNLSRRRTPEPESQASDIPAVNTTASPKHTHNVETSFLDPWNSPIRFFLEQDEQRYFEYYVNVVGPILDLFDPERHFTVAVPHLALQNEGLLKSLLAVAARHSALQKEASTAEDYIETAVRSNLNEPSDDASTNPSSQSATRYYYETLRYLSQNLLYPSYTRSLELLATAILISTYEMFDAYTSGNINSWQKHLQGAFFIQNV